MQKKASHSCLNASFFGFQSRISPESFAKKPESMDNMDIELNEESKEVINLQAQLPSNESAILPAVDSYEEKSLFGLVLIK
jgi:hypothetical protein